MSITHVPPGQHSSAQQTTVSRSLTVGPYGSTVSGTPAAGGPIWNENSLLGPHYSNILFFTKKITLVAVVSRTTPRIETE